MKDSLKITSGALPKSARVLGFRGKEAISRLYRFEVFIEVPADESLELDTKAAVAQPATLELDRDDGTDPARFHGILAGVELLREVPDGRGVYKLTIVPKLWLLTKTFHSRIFTDKKLPEIIEDVLKKAGLSGDDYQLKLDGTYEPEEHVTEYRESDLDFLSRWMEREGIYYFFEHGEEKEKLVITDVKSTHEPARDRPIPYHPISGADVTSGEAWNTFTSRSNALPKSLSLKDYDYLKPTLDVSGKADVDPQGKGEINTYGYRFFTPDNGKRLAKINAEQLLSTQVVFTGVGGVSHLHAGYLFEVEDHPRPAFNARYLLTEVEHLGNTAAGTSGVTEIEELGPKPGYTVEVSAISADVQFRAARETRWPRIYGVENALVDGPAESDYAQLDKHGRYEVKFFFDESDLQDGKASTWIRMLQPHAGNPEGFHFPLRKGTEVMVIFLGGDPDRPMITGAIPNMANPSPVTSANNTQNVIHTGGNTRIEIEDKDGAQYIDISTPPKHTFLHMGEPHGPHSHYIVENTEGNCLFNIGGDQDIEVGGKLTEHVVGVVTETYDADQDSTVGGNQTLEVAGDVDEEIGGDQTLEVGGDLDEEIGGDVTLEVGGDWDAEVGGDVTLEAGGDWDAEIGGDVTLEAGGDWDAEIGGDVTLEAGGEVSWEIGGNVTWEVGGAIEITAPSVTVTTPKWEVQSPDESWLSAAFKFILGQDTEVKGYKSEVVGLAIGITGINLELKGVDVSLKGLAVDSTGLQLENEPINLKTKGLDLKTCALNFATAGLTTIL